MAPRGALRTSPNYECMRTKQMVRGANNSLLTGHDEVAKNQEDSGASIPRLSPREYEWYDLSTTCTLKGINTGTTLNRPCSQRHNESEYRMSGRYKRWYRRRINWWLTQNSAEHTKGGEL